MIQARSKFRGTCSRCRRPVAERQRIVMEFWHSHLRRGKRTVVLSMSRWVHEVCPARLSTALEEARGRRLRARAVG